jgi:hypothetical protein
MNASASSLLPAGGRGASAGAAGWAAGARFFGAAARAAARLLGDFVALLDFVLGLGLAIRSLAQVAHRKPASGARPRKVPVTRFASGAAWAPWPRFAALPTGRWRSPASGW